MIKYYIKINYFINIIINLNKLECKICYCNKISDIKFCNICNFEICNKCMRICIKQNSKCPQCRQQLPEILIKKNRIHYREFYIENTSFNRILRIICFVPLFFAFFILFMLNI